MLPSISPPKLAVEWDAPWPFDAGESAAVVEASECMKGRP
jgi:hypothetical protein